VGTCAGSCRCSTLSSRRSRWSRLPTIWAAAASTARASWARMRANRGAETQHRLMTSLPPLAVTRAASDARNATLRPVHLPCRPACVGSSGPTNPSWVPVGPKGLPRISFDCPPDQRAAPLRANRSIACAHAAFPLVLHTRNWERFERRTPGVLFSILSLRSNKLPFLTSQQRPTRL